MKNSNQQVINVNDDNDNSQAISGLLNLSDEIIVNDRENEAINLIEEFISTSSQPVSHDLREDTPSKKKYCTVDGSQTFTENEVTKRGKFFYLLDGNGNIAKDESGNDIVVITIRQKTKNKSYHTLDGNYEFSGEQVIRSGGLYEVFFNGIKTSVLPKHSFVRSLKNQGIDIFYSLDGVPFAAHRVWEENNLFYVNSNNIVVNVFTLPEKEFLLKELNPKKNNKPAQQTRKRKDNFAWNYIKEAKKQNAQKTTQLVAPTQNNNNNQDIIRIDVTDSEDESLNNATIPTANNIAMVKPDLYHFQPDAGLTEELDNFLYEWSAYQQYPAMESATNNAMDIPEELPLQPNQINTHQEFQAQPIQINLGSTNLIQPIQINLHPGYSSQPIQINVNASGLVASLPTQSNAPVDLHPQPLPAAPQQEEDVLSKYFNFICKPVSEKMLQESSVKEVSSRQTSSEDVLGTYFGNIMGSQASSNNRSSVLESTPGMRPHATSRMHTTTSRGQRKTAWYSFNSPTTNSTPSNSVQSDSAPAPVQKITGLSKRKI